MVKVVDLTETKLAALWREVKDQDADDFWGDLKEETLRIAKALIEGHLESEMIERVGAGLYQRHPDRSGWRNGHYSRNLLTEMGLITDLQVPRCRKSLRPSELPETYKKEQGQLKGLIREAFLAGVLPRSLGMGKDAASGRGIGASSG